MTHDKHRKRDIRAEARRTGRTYQQVLEDRWRPGDEIELQQRLAATIREALGTWPSHIPADGEAIDDLVAQLMYVAIERRPLTDSTRHWVDYSLGHSEGRRKTLGCMRAVSHFVCNRLDRLEEQEACTKDMTMAVASIVVRRGPDHASAKDDAYMTEEIDNWLSDCAEQERLTDSDE